MTATSFLCPKCGSKYFGRDVGDNGPLNTVRCHGQSSAGPGQCDWRGEWPPEPDFIGSVKMTGMQVGPVAQCGIHYSRPLNSPYRKPFTVGVVAFNPNTKVLTIDRALDPTPDNTSRIIFTTPPLAQSAEIGCAIVVPSLTVSLPDDGLPAPEIVEAQR